MAPNTPISFNEVLEVSECWGCSACWGAEDKVLHFSGDSGRLKEFSAWTVEKAVAALLAKRSLDSSGSNRGMPSLTYWWDVGGDPLNYHLFIHMFVLPIGVGNYSCICSYMEQSLLLLSVNGAGNLTKAWQNSPYRYGWTCDSAFPYFIL